MNGYNVYCDMEVMKMAARTRRKVPLNAHIKLTENGYTPEFEAAAVAASEELTRELANGTSKLYNNCDEMFAAWDKEDEDGDE